MNTVPDFTPDEMDPSELDPDKVFPMIDKLGIQFVEITHGMPSHAARIAEEDQRELDDAVEFYKNVKKGETDG
tara:strand:- start:306 stop:524 length:219 start_codon:yes stop_codon:yes gene_type:complete